ncbi:MAG TPA: VWA domain-containing protein [Pyrinomonadaceae bacterium]|jgi:VWFA-related protein
MKKQSPLAFVLILALFVQGAGQTPKPQPPTAPVSTPQQQQAQNDDDVVRISTNLVQVDAVITDKAGRLVTDLRPEELEIYEDGRLQTITNFSLVSTESPAPPARETAAAAARPVERNVPPVPPSRLRPEQIQRTVALVVDDLGLSFESTHFVREALKKFVDQQMQPGDLVAIIRTGGGMGALQQFTSDKRQLYAAIERVKWSFQGRSSVAAFPPMTGRDPSAQDGMGLEEDQPGIIKGTDPDQFREEIFSVGTLGALNYVVRGMRELPGRKSILLMSDGIPVFIKGDASRSTRILDALRRLTDQANRASVVIYSMDARGLPTFGLNAADDTSGMSAQQVDAALQERRDDFFESQNGLNYLSQQTGGFFIRNSNDLSTGIRSVLEDQKGYYLIGYRPDESTFDKVTGRRKFHRILIKVKRPGLRVRSRTGFYGISNEEADPQPKTRASQLIGALTSPFASGGVHLRLTSLFGTDPKTGPFVRSLLHIDARDLTFTDEPDGWHKAVFDVFAVTFGDNGTIVDHVDRVQTVRVRGETYKRALQNGFVFTVTVPIKKPGAYQLRAALRDIASEHVGSASQFIEVPDVGKNRLALSGIVVNGSNPAANRKATETDTAGAALAAGAQAGRGEEEIADKDPQAGPAVRKFRRGMVLQYDYLIYNAQPARDSGRPQVQTQMRIFRDGKPLFTGRVQPLDPGAQSDFKRIAAGGALQLGTDMTPGEYVLQVIVTDPFAKDKYRMATQWIDFEIVK